MCRHVEHLNKKMKLFSQNTVILRARPPPLPGTGVHLIFLNDPTCVSVVMLQRGRPDVHLNSHGFQSYRAKASKYPKHQGEAPGAVHSLAPYSVDCPCKTPAAFGGGRRASSASLTVARNGALGATGGGTRTFPTRVFYYSRGMTIF